MFGAKICNCLINCDYNWSHLNFICILFPAIIPSFQNFDLNLAESSILKINAAQSSLTKNWVHQNCFQVKDSGFQSMKHCSYSDYCYCLDRILVHFRFSPLYPHTTIGISVWFPFHKPKLCFSLTQKLWSHNTPKSFPDIILTCFLSQTYL